MGSWRGKGTYKVYSTESPMSAVRNDADRVREAERLRSRVLFAVIKKKYRARRRRRGFGIRGLSLYLHITHTLRAGTSEARGGWRK